MLLYKQRGNLYNHKAAVIDLKSFPREKLLRANLGFISEWDFLLKLIFFFTTYNSACQNLLKM